MDSNPYSPPVAELEQDLEQASCFYVVSPRKFTLLYFSTFGLYMFYWFYANWNEYRRATGHKVWPVPRALFNILFTLLALLFFALKYFTLITPQKAINTVNGSPAGESNSSLTWGNYIWIALGAIIWLLSIAGYLIGFGIIELADFQ
ncbi:MAG: hypothetical protein P8166_13140 [Candidatus Thiodiazotropha sp.]